MVHPIASHCRVVKKPCGAGVGVVGKAVVSKAEGARRHRSIELKSLPKSFPDNQALGVLSNPGSSDDGIAPPEIKSH